MPTKYTKEILTKVASESRNITDLMRRLGVFNYSGGMSNHFASRLRFYQIDTSHFLGKSSRSGMHSSAKKSAAEILIIRPATERRKDTYRLRRALLEIGRPHLCAKCGLGDQWNGGPLVLEIDHINGQRTDDREENLQFLCPNCHSQAPIAQR